MPTRYEIMDYIGANGACTAREIADALLGEHEHPRPIHNACRALENEGLLVSSQIDGGKHYYLSDAEPGPITAPTNRVSPALPPTVMKLGDSVVSKRLGCNKNVKVVIQCAGSKFNAETLCENESPLDFVAQPPLEPPNGRAPWDMNVNRDTNWIDCVRVYNDRGGLLPIGVTVSGSGILTEAGMLYRHPIYRNLIQICGMQNVYILSAGWGLVRSSDKIPAYNITFSNDAPAFAYVSPKARFQHSTVRNTIDITGEIHLFMTPKYVTYIVKLNPFINNQRGILHWRIGQKLPSCWHGEVRWHDCSNCNIRKWPYEAARQFLGTPLRETNCDVELQALSSIPRQPQSQLMPPIDAYKKVYHWYKGNIDLIRPDNTVYLPIIAPHAVLLTDADEARGLIMSLPDPEVVSEIELQTVMREIIVGHLQWAFHATDGTAKMSDYARMVITEHPMEWHISAAEKDSLQLSVMYPWLSRLHK